MPTAYGNPNSPLGQAKLAAARAVGLDANANWAQIKKAQETRKAQQATQQATQQSSKRAEQLKKQAIAAKAAADLTIKKNQNEASLASQNKSQTAESKINTDEQNEREEMVRTFKSKRRGRAALRINLGSSSGSPYEGSSGISITL
jgi:hypothetical protein